MATDPRTVVSRWPVDPVVGVEPLPGGQNPVYRIDTSSGDVWVLKSRGTPDEARLARLAFDADVMRHLDVAGVGVPVPQLDRDGRLWAEVDGEVYTLARHLPAGRPLATDGEHRRWWLAVGRAMAELHLALASYPAHEAHEAHEAHDLMTVTWQEDLPSRLSAGSAVVSGKLHGDQRDRFDGAARAAIDRGVAALEGLPEQLIHRDAHPGNLVSDGPRVVGFIDCDHFCVGPRVLDLAYFAVHMVKWNVADPDAAAEWLARLPLLFAGYEDVVPLSPRERAAFPYALLAVVAMFAASARAQGEVLQTEVTAFLWLADNLAGIEHATTVTGVIT